MNNILSWEELSKFKIDDSLDVFAVHGVGGMLGIILTSFFAHESFGGLGLGENVTIGTAFSAQLIATIVTVVWAAFATYIIILVVRATVGLRVNEEDESEGLDLSSHGERGYDL